MESKTVVFHNKISPNFQQVSVDGAHGGISPQGKININFFAERFPIPKSSSIEVQENKVVKVTDSDDSKIGIIREFHFGAYMSADTAKGIATWLLDRVKELEAKAQAK
ncbi:MAG: hypothetical protein A2293_07360 [Elusimicrobia bacterium RIFOXYB2_FULL_49_7]|nr:MAG: hypothetical protein A2293_07360 [Elusimicrobia bacterium RIFOXYB2_FULL_49_7]